MGRRYTQLLRWLGLAGLMCVMLAAPTTRGAVLTYPSAGACNTTLQACIDAASPGDAVEVATSGPISEDLTIDKSLTVRPAAGFGPVLNDFASVLLLNPEPKSNSIVFEGFTIDPGFVRALQGSSNPFDVRIRNLLFTGTFNDRSAIDVGTGSNGPYGPVSFEISDNDVTIPSAFNGVEAITAFGGDATTFEGTIHGNSILHLAGGQNGAIGVFNNASDLDVDVIGNKITGSNFNAGVHFFQFGPGQSDVRFINNFVEGQVDEAGQPAAVAINVSDGDTTFQVLNNTLVNSETGILVGGRPDLGATWNGVIANNIVANMSGTGIGIEDPFAAVVNENNLVFNTGDDFFAPGPGTLFVDPQFVGGGDFRLTYGSPAQNAGNDARVPGDITVDLGGEPRIQVAAVDMGAYEVVVPEPSTAAMLLAAALALSCLRPGTRLGQPRRTDEDRTP